jgi:hypothetical protein
MKKTKINIVNTTPIKQEPRITIHYKKNKVQHSTNIQNSFEPTNIFPF